MRRDEFPQTVVRIIGERAAYYCSNPNCRNLTISAHSQTNKSLSKGVAAHIFAASPGGPRYNPNQSTGERKSPDNGIWLCHNCSDVVDKDELLYTGELLLEWKKTHVEFINNLLMPKKTLPKGGDGGHIFLFTDTIIGSGTIDVSGGDGPLGGNAGTINIQSRVNKYNGKLIAEGGKSTM
jgi:hypothetical protein